MLLTVGTTTCFSSLKPDKGWGYYNLKTREAYKIILNRIKLQLAILSDRRQKVVLCAFLIVVCLPCILLSSLPELNKKIKELEMLRLIVTRRLASSGPDAELVLPNNITDYWKQRHDKLVSKKNLRHHSTSTGHYYPYMFYNDPYFYTETTTYTWGGGEFTSTGDVGGGTDFGGDFGGGGFGDFGGGGDF